MTEKRFTNHITKTDADGTIHTDGIFDANENNKILITNYFYIAQVMNELYHENEQLKSQMENLFNHYAKWFEEERGIYIEEFYDWWESIKKGDVE